MTRVVEHVYGEHTTDKFQTFVPYQQRHAWVKVALS